MRPVLVRLLLRLYPAHWKQRYGSEFSDLLQSEEVRLSTLTDVIRSAISEHLSPTVGATMNRQIDSFGVLVKRPSALLPLAMSLGALTVVVITATVFGINRQPDEGTPAHLWQLLMAGQLPMLLFFVIRWGPQAPRQTIYVLALQAAAFLLAAAPVFLLHL
ncbi:MAG TPA: hypothetical protein VL495_04465 [Edaphobacter sp.]|jgi:hypothetical protein|nr:hypothetical protein [Edaphobacter sp.]